MNIHQARADVFYGSSTTSIASAWERIGSATPTNHTHTEIVKLTVSACSSSWARAACSGIVESSVVCTTALPVASGASVADSSSDALAACSGSTWSRVDCAPVGCDSAVAYNSASK